MARRQHHSGARPRRVWPWVVGVPVATLLVLGGLFAWDGWQLLNAKDDLAAHAAATQDALTARDADALVTEAAALETAARRFADATDGPHWWLATRTPWVADQAVPLADAGAAVAAMAEGALSPLASMGDLSALEAPQFVDGRIDPYVLEPYRETLAQAAETLNAEVDRLTETDLTGTLDAVAQPFLELEAQLAEVRDVVQGAHVAAEVLPSMLGGEGERHYLVMVQNNAEPRTTGGIPGAILEVTVEDGRIALGQFLPAWDLASSDGVGGLTEDEERIFTRRMEVYPQDVNFTPEFPRSAEMMLRFWRQKQGEGPSGVISIDPVALGWMLDDASPTIVDDVSIDAGNLAEVMLNRSYFLYPDPIEQDAFFARASAALFQKLVSEPTSAMTGVERAIQADRFMVWSETESEQALLATVPVAGAFLDQDDALGIFLNDGSGSKIGWYVDVETDVTDHLCTDGSLAGQSVDVTLTHTFDGDVAELPDYLAVGGGFVEPGEFHANLLLYPAVGSGVTGFTRDGEGAGLNPEIHRFRPMSTVRIVLEPGQTTTVSYEITANATAMLSPRVIETPGPKPNVYSRSADVLLDGC